VDAGYETAHAAFRVPPNYDARGPIVTARLGVYGSPLETHRRFVMRGGFVLFVHEEMTSYTDTTQRHGWGFGIEISVGYRL
jgi:hypothetical protein